MSEPTLHLAVRNFPIIDWDLMLRIPIVELGLCLK